jgi:polyphosphate kinase 2 (PPK2 family)
MANHGPQNPRSGSHHGAKRYKHALHELQKQLILGRDKILVILEGRDAAGKDGVIKRITRHLSPRETRIVALGPPSDRESGA